MHARAQFTLTAQIGLQFDDAGHHLCGDLLDRVGAGAGRLGEAAGTVATVLPGGSGEYTSSAATPPTRRTTTAIAVPRRKSACASEERLCGGRSVEGCASGPEEREHAPSRSRLVVPGVASARRPSPPVPAAEIAIPAAPR